MATEVIQDLDQLYQPIYMHRLIKLTPQELSGNLEDILMKKLTNQLEEKCIKEGYVRKGSIQLIRRSVGMMNENQFTGDIHFYFLLMAQVCNPSVGMHIRAMVFQNHKIGILATFGPLEILLPREIHVDKSVFANFKRGDWIDIILLGKRFKLNDKKIFTFGIYREDTEGVARMVHGVQPKQQQSQKQKPDMEETEIVIPKPKSKKHEHEHDHEHMEEKEDGNEEREIYIEEPIEEDEEEEDDE